MSFQDRVKNAKNNRQGFKFPAGVIRARFVEHKFGKSKSGDDMFTLIFKPLKVKSLEDSKLNADDVMDTINEKGKKIEVKLLVRLDFQLDRVLEFISDAGMDLSDCDENDKKFVGVRKQLTELEELRPQADIHVKPNEEDDRYRNYSIREVQKVGDFELDMDGDDEEEAPAPKKKAKSAPVNEDGYTYDELIEDGWKHNQIAKKYPELV